MFSRHLVIIFNAFGVSLLDFPLISSRYSGGSGSGSGTIVALEASGRGTAISGEAVVRGVWAAIGAVATEDSDVVDGIDAMEGTDGLLQPVNPVIARTISINVMLLVLNFIMVRHPFDSIIPNYGHK